MTGKEALEIIRGAGLSQYGAARLLGISPTSLSHWSKGRNGPSGSTETLLLMLRFDSELTKFLLRRVRG